jgi:hypothetical protein
MDERVRLDEAAFRAFIAATLRALAGMGGRPIENNLAPSDFVRAWPWGNTGVEPLRVEDALAWVFYVANMNAEIPIKVPADFNRRALRVESVQTPIGDGLSVSWLVWPSRSDRPVTISTDPEYTSKYYNADDFLPGEDVTAIQRFLERVIERANRILPEARLLNTGDPARAQ